MVKLEWGTKRTCQNCTSRFYDMRRSPIACPKCGTAFDIQMPGRRSRNRTAMADDGTTKPLGDDMLITELDISTDLDTNLEEQEDGLIEDTSDLGEDLDDMTNVIDKGEEGEE